ncbi:MAG: GyrI-like domain-containing protein [Lachnospiraceae bacterium]
MSDIFQNEYLLRIYKVQDYIEKNYFKNASVDRLAEVAGFSKYHFNRIFKSILNESISQYANRIRIESREDRTAVYVRHVGDYRSLKRNYAKLMQQLVTESAKQHLMEQASLEILVMYHDNPEFSKEEQFQDAWEFMYQQWLITSNYVPRDACPFEVYLNNPAEEPDYHIEVDIYMPIEPI